MRCASLLFLAVTGLQGGCSTLVIGSGERLDELTTQAQVHQAFGEPVATGVEDGLPYEDFRTHRKIAEPWKSIYLAMGYVCTAGLGEFVWFPHQSYLAVRRSIVGQDLRFIYDASGTVAGIRFEGDWVKGEWPNPAVGHAPRAESHVTGPTESSPER